MARKWAKKIGDGKEILLGLCEGHGTRVSLYRQGKQLFIEHASFVSYKPSAGVICYAFL